MPKVPVDYSNTCIYKLVHFDDLNDENIYIGHTTNMVKRRYNHKKACCNPNNKDYNSKAYQFIRENGGWDNWEMILVEKYSCNSINEAIARERYWKEHLKATLNTVVPGRTIKEWCEDNKQYLKEHKRKYNENNKEKIKEQRSNFRKNNKEKLAEKNKEWRENNKEKISQNRKEKYEKNKHKIAEKITCNCGSVIRSSDIRRHEKSIKHQEWLKNNNLCTN